MSYKRRMIEGPHPLAGKLIFLPADIQFAAIEWIREPATTIDRINNSQDRRQRRSRNVHKRKSAPRNRQ